MNHYRYRTWAEVNLDNLAFNITKTRKVTSKNARIMAAVKADAYGHGVAGTVKTLLENGVDCLAVSMLDEAIQLRKNGINVPILVLNHTHPARAGEIIEYDITQTVFETSFARSLSEAAQASGTKVRIHVKIDTGMSRVGFAPGYNAVKCVVEMEKMKGLAVEGIFTHFATADDVDCSFTYIQFERFMSIITELGRIGIHIPIKHCANSAALLKFPEMHLDMVRPGIILYGLYPSDDPLLRNSAIIGKDLFRPVMEMKSSIIQIKEVEAGTSVSYGCTYKANRKTRLATIPAGYADGYSRLLSNKAKVLVNGQCAPVAGRICMDQCLIDITDIDGKVDTGDEVVLFGRQNNGFISVDELARMMSTINYELVCIIGKRVPRVYFKDGKVEEIVNYLL